MKSSTAPAKSARGKVAPDSREIIKSKRSKEIFFGVVGPVGAGGSRVVASLRRACVTAGYECESIKLSSLIREWAKANAREVPAERLSLGVVKKLQDLGDAMREQDSSEVARAALREIAKRRAKATGQQYIDGTAVKPDDKKRAYLIESIRHPSEIRLFRRTYSHAFALVGVVCEETERERRILGKYFTDPERLLETNIQDVKTFMARDADDSKIQHGQHATDAFFESDFFVDNTVSDPTDKDQLLDEALGRLVGIVSHSRVIRPFIEETSMHHAHSARVRSACMSRQVGAALVDGGGTVIATGCNEVPRAGGGVYGEFFQSESHVHDERCVFALKYCSSNREQNKIVDELIAAIPELNSVVDRENLRGTIRKTRLGQLIEFSRAVHAEMDALLSAGREGISTIGARMFVTTFPCHYCARHIVSSGVIEVQYIEPYPKSLAIQLHNDAIEVDPARWLRPDGAMNREKRSAAEQSAQKQPPGKVLFRPFVGVAPRLYGRAFEETWRLKNKITGNLEMNAPEWGDDWAPFTEAYPELEAALAR